MSAHLEPFLAGLVDAIAAEVAARLTDARPTTPAAELEWRLVDEATAAGLLGRSPRWLRERRKRGSISYVRLDGGRSMYRLEDLQAFADSKLVRAASGLEGHHLQAVAGEELRP